MLGLGLARLVLEAALGELVVVHVPVPVLVPLREDLVRRRVGVSWDWGEVEG